MALRLTFFNLHIYPSLALPIPTRLIQWFYNFFSGQNQVDLASSNRQQLLHAVRVVKSNQDLLFIIYLFIIYYIFIAYTNSVHKRHINKKVMEFVKGKPKGTNPTIMGNPIDICAVNGSKKRV